MGFRWSATFRRSQTGSLKFYPEYSEYFDQQRFTPPPPNSGERHHPSPESPAEGGSEYKYEKAFCPPERVEGNPCLEYVHHLIFSWFHEFTVESSKKNGEDNYIKFEKLSAAYAKGGVHPGDVKPSLAKALNRTLELKKEVSELTLQRDVCSVSG